MARRNTDLTVGPFPNRRAGSSSKRPWISGINFFGTANVCSFGSSEDIVGAALKELTARDAVVIAAKELETIRQLTLLALAIDGGPVKSVRSYQVRSFEIFGAQVSNDDGDRTVFSSMPAEADRQQPQLHGEVIERATSTFKPFRRPAEDIGLQR
jgi:hypothetical protein